MWESVYAVSGPEFTHLSLSLLFYFEFMINVNRSDERETFSKFTKCVYPSMEGGVPRNIKQFALETLSVGTYGIEVNKANVLKNNHVGTGLKQRSAMNILSNPQLSTLGNFKKGINKDNKRNEERKKKTKKNGMFFQI